MNKEMFIKQSDMDYKFTKLFHLQKITSQKGRNEQKMIDFNLLTPSPPKKNRVLLFLMIDHWRRSLKLI